MDSPKHPVISNFYYFQLYLLCYILQLFDKNCLSLLGVKLKIRITNEKH